MVNSTAADLFVRGTASLLAGLVFYLLNDLQSRLFVSPPSGHEAPGGRDSGRNLQGQPA